MRLKCSNRFRHRKTALNPGRQHRFQNDVFSADRPIDRHIYLRLYVFDSQGNFLPVPGNHSAADDLQFSGKLKQNVVGGY